MAKNWTMAEAMKVISAADLNSEEIADLYKRFPNVARLMTAIASGDTMAAKMLIGFLPEWATVGKLEKAIKNAGEADDNAEDDVTSGDEEVEEETEEEEAPKPKKKARKSKKAVKVEEPEDEENDDSDEEDSETTDYESMTAQELFKLCKEKGIAVKPKRSVKFYVEKLKAAEDAQDGDSDSDDWADDEVEETPKAKKAAKPAAEKAAPKKSKKAAKVEDDDDEDWDI
jgi:hypothetical protein